MKEEKLKAIQKDLESIITFEQGRGVMSNTFFGAYEGYKISLTYREKYSLIWIGRFKGVEIDLSINLSDCRVFVENGQARFIDEDTSVSIGVRK